MAAVATVLAVEAGQESEVSSVVLEKEEVGKASSVVMEKEEVGKASSVAEMAAEGSAWGAAKGSAATMAGLGATVPRHLPPPGVLPMLPTTNELVDMSAPNKYSSS